MKVGLFVPCYINAVYPEVGVASYKLLKSLGVRSGGCLLQAPEKPGGGCGLSIGPDLLRTADGKCRV